MRYSDEHVRATRERIVRAAARQFRANGFEATGIASVMREADLTHGGFYSHFRSKQALIDAVIESGFDGIGPRFDAALEGLEGEAWLRAWVERYLSPEHRARTGDGCPLPALAAEIARGDESMRARMDTVLRDRIDAIAARVPAPPAEATRRATAALAQMAGAMMLARSVDAELSSELLEAARTEALRTMLAPFDADANRRGGA